MDGVIEIENFINKKDCKSIIKKFKNELTLQPAKIGNDVIRLNKRKSQVAFVENINIIDNKLIDILKKNILLKGFEVTNLGKYQFTEYNTGDFYEWHNDGDETMHSYRYCSIVIQLNDNYENGHLEIKTKNNESYIVKKGIGNLSIFLSNKEHRVTPVTNGVRYTLVNWVGLKKIENFKKSLL